MKLSMFLVEPWEKAEIFRAIVPGGYEEALKRLRDDDPIWRSPYVYYKGTWEVDEDKSRCRPANRLNIKIWSPS